MTGPFFTPELARSKYSGIEPQMARRPAALGYGFIVRSKYTFFRRLSFSEKKVFRHSTQGILHSKLGELISHALWITFVVLALYY